MSHQIKCSVAAGFSLRKSVHSTEALRKLKFAATMEEHRIGYRKNPVDFENGFGGPIEFVFSL